MQYKKIKICLQKAFHILKINNVKPLQRKISKIFFLNIQTIHVLYPFLLIKGKSIFVLNSFGRGIFYN